MNKTIRGWVVVNKRGTPFVYGFGTTRTNAQFNYLDAMTWEKRPLPKWADYEAKGHATVRATMIVETASKPASKRKAKKETPHV